jgi:hypothetical protein
MDDPRIIAAIVSTAVAAVVGVITAVLTVRWQYRAKLIELEQTQLKEVLLRRLDAYARLWQLLLSYGRNWEIEGKQRDAGWAKEFLQRLNACNAEWGVFFSQAVYEKFHEYRTALTAIESKLAAGNTVPEAEFHRLTAISTGNDRVLGLGTQLKADLGSYRSMALRGQP